MLYFFGVALLIGIYAYAMEDDDPDYSKLIFFLLAFLAWPLTISGLGVWVSLISGNIAVEELRKKKKQPTKKEMQQEWWLGTVSGTIVGIALLCVGLAGYLSLRG